LDNREARRFYGRWGISRRQFLNLSDIGLAGAGLLGATGRDGGEEGKGGAGTFAFGPDQGGSLRMLINRFNRQNKGETRVNWRQTPAARGEYFDQIRAEPWCGQSEVYAIGGGSSGPPSSPQAATSSPSPTASARV